MTVDSEDQTMSAGMFGLITLSERFHALTTDTPGENRAEVFAQMCAFARDAFPEFEFDAQPNWRLSPERIATLRALGSSVAAGALLAYTLDSLGRYAGKVGEAGQLTAAQRQAALAWAFRLSGPQGAAGPPDDDRGIACGHYTEALAEVTAQRGEGFGKTVAWKKATVDLAFRLAFQKVYGEVYLSALTDHKRKLERLKKIVREGRGRFLSWDVEC